MTGGEDECAFPSANGVVLIQLELHVFQAIGTLALTEEERTGRDFEPGCDLPNALVHFPEEKLIAVELFGRDGDDPSLPAKPADGSGDLERRETKAWSGGGKETPKGAPD